METYYEQHREERLAYQKLYELRHPRDRKAYRQRNKNRIRKYYAQWYRENGRNRADNYMESTFEWQKAFPERVKIQRQLQRAVRSGKISRPEKCSKCRRRKKVQAHHVDYDHYLHFVWLCASCHKLEHPGNAIVDKAGGAWVATRAPGDLSKEKMDELRPRWPWPIGCGIRKYNEATSTCCAGHPGKTC